LSELWRMKGGYLGLNLESVGLEDRRIERVLEI
jgi:hypothetical protein